MSPHIFAFERRLPAWARPTCRGAFCLLGLGVGVAGGIYVLTLVAALMLLVGVANGVVLFLGILGVTIGAGAAGGAIHGVLAPLGQWSRLGSSLRWFAALLAAFVTSILLTPRGPFSLEDPNVWLIAVSVATLGAGTLVLLDDRRLDRLTPHQYRWLQNRERRWAAQHGMPVRSRPRVTGGRSIGGQVPILARVTQWWRVRRRRAAVGTAVRTVTP